MFSILLLAGPAAAGGTPPSELWNARCKSCHAEDGTAQTRRGRKEKIPDFTTAAWQASLSDAQIRQVITEGSPKNSVMKSFKDRLSAEEIDALVQYIRTLPAR